MTDWLNRTHLGDCRTLMRAMIADGVKVQCVVTSPPYWGLRDYGVSGQIGLERSFTRYLARIRGVFRLVQPLLAGDGLLWLNMGDAYANDGKWGGQTGGKQSYLMSADRLRCGRQKRRTGLKPKDLVGMPWRVAFALQADGWWLRQDIIWHKTNPMPESMRDRPTKAHEYLFLMSRSARYYYDAEAIKEKASTNSHLRGGGVNPKAMLGRQVAGWDNGPGGHSAKDHARAKQGLRDSTKFGRGKGWRNKQNESFSAAITELVETRNVRSVWTMPTEPFGGAHFATFPQELVARCILAGSRPGDTVFDPFMGSGTVAQVATDLGRNFIGCELSAKYMALHDLRRTTQGMVF